MLNVLFPQVHGYTLVILIEVTYHAYYYKCVRCMEE